MDAIDVRVKDELDSLTDQLQKVLERSLDVDFAPTEDVIVTVNAQVLGTGFERPDHEARVRLTTLHREKVAEHFGNSGRNDRSRKGGSVGLHIRQDLVSVRRQGQRGALTG